MKLTNTLIRFGFTRSKADYSLFIRAKATSFLVILVNVDDLLIVGDNKDEIQEIKEALNMKFNIKDLGTTRYFLGLEIAQSRERIALGQRKYCLDLLKNT
jgi:hypothetical protein